MRAACVSCRFLLAVIVVLALVGCGRDQPRGGHAAGAGDFAGPVDIGDGRHLYLECRGQGSPTILLESGYHDSSDPWVQSNASAPAVGPAVLAALADGHRVCAYDRPGTVRHSEPPSISDRSTPVTMPRTARDVVSDLHKLLGAAHVAGPYILVGHSLGGVFARLYAQTHPDDVRAILFVDAFSVDMPALMGSEWPTYKESLDTPSPQLKDTASFEMIDIEQSVGQVATAPALPPVPIMVLTKGDPFVPPSSVPPEKAEFSEKLEQAWLQGQSELVGLRPQTPQVVAAGSDHYVQIHQPDLVVAGVELLLRRIAGNR
ncbi:alpha/beta hydrolase [Mycobacterium intermedium]|nr:alpha/beta hydrolase [Mycobacterium intermedium]MCV6962971.1 alpha/beta hydrolase [Mycobacterium intermedium]